MLGPLILLWFVTSVGVVAYGVSNKAVLTLGLPRWSSFAVAGVGCAMLLFLFAGMFYGAATDVPWFNGGVPAATDD